MNTFLKVSSGITCAALLVIFAALSIFAVNFVNGWFVPWFLAALLAAIFFGLMKLTDRFLTFTPPQRALWVSCASAVSSWIIWSAYWILREIGMRLQSLGPLSNDANPALIVTYGSGYTVVTPLVLSMGLLIGAYLSLRPASADVSFNSAWWLAPLISVAIGALLGFWFPIGGNLFNA